jgi:hypothetical protein
LERPPRRAIEPAGLAPVQIQSAPAATMFLLGGLDSKAGLDSGQCRLKMEGEPDRAKKVNQQGEQNTGRKQRKKDEQKQRRRDNSNQ